MGNCGFGMNTQTDLIRTVAFDYEVDPEVVTIVSQMNNIGQGMYQVKFPGLDTPIRYDRIGSVYVRHSTAPPLPYEKANRAVPAGTPSKHAVIQYAAMDNQVPVNTVTMIKMIEDMGSGSYDLNVNGKRMVYKKIGSVFMKGDAPIPGINTFT